MTKKQKKTLKRILAALVLTVLLARGHVLLEDIPGCARPLWALRAARSLTRIS